MQHGLIFIQFSHLWSFQERHNDNLQAALVQWYWRLPKEFLYRWICELVRQWGFCLSPHGDLFLTVSTLEWVSAHYMRFICGIFLCTVPSSGGWSGRSSDTCALHSAVSSPICQLTLDAAVHGYQQ